MRRHFHFVLWLLSTAETKSSGLFTVACQSGRNKSGTNYTDNGSAESLRQYQGLEGTAPTFTALITAVQLVWQCKMSAAKECCCKCKKWSSEIRSSGLMWLFEVGVNSRCIKSPRVEAGHEETEALSERKSCLSWLKGLSQRSRGTKNGSLCLLAALTPSTVPTFCQIGYGCNGGRR